MPHFVFSPSAELFIEAAYKMDWVHGGFDWPEWQGSEEALELFNDQECLADASPEQLERSLTMLIRKERFCEGSLAAAFESGLLTAICRRASQLISE